MSAGIPSYGATAAGAVGKVANVLPNWWAFSFVGLQAVRISPLYPERCDPPKHEIRDPRYGQVIGQLGRTPALACPQAARLELTKQAALLPLAAQYFFTPLAVFADIIPPGIDKATDGLQKSLRVEIANKNAAHCTFPLCYIGLSVEQSVQSGLDHDTAAQPAQSPTLTFSVLDDRRSLYRLYPLRP